MTEIRSDALRAWRERGQIVDAFGMRLFVVEAPGPSDRKPLLVLHGFPTSSFDFRGALPLLAQARPVVLFDFPGFGLSDKPADYSYSLLEQAECAIEVWRSLGHTRGHLLAHDYGTSVATELLARRTRGLLPFEFDSVTLCNGSVHIELAHLTVSQKILRDPRVGPVFARLASRAFFKARLKAIFARPDALQDDELDAMWEALTAGGGRSRISEISQYLRERRRFAHRWIGALLDLDLPTHVVWGRHDPIAVPDIARQLEREIPDVELTWLEELGHYPQAEDPRSFANAVLGWLHDKD